MTSNRAAGTTQEAKRPGLIDQYRVLDLTDAKGQLAGKTLADMGADVIKIEPPKGDPSRNIPPFYHDDPNPEKSLWWWAYNTSKRGITLDLTTADGQALFKRLVERVDVVLESFKPGYLASLGLGYSDLVKVNSKLVMASLTPFGQTGPYKDFNATDFITVAMSGNMHMTGDADRPPLACQVPTTWYHAGAECANAILTALWHREQTGEGQHIDTSIYETMQLIAYSSPTMWVQRKERGKRSGARYTVKGPKGVTFQREIWPCKDGFISFGMRGGPARIPPFQRLVQWMKAEGAKVSHLDSIDWKNYNNNNLTQEEVDKMTAELQAFFMSKSAKELYEAAVEKVLMIAPIYNPELQLQDRHLQDRKFFVPIEHPELKTSIVYPSAFAKSEQAFVGIRRRAPLISEHNIEVYETELGLTREQLVTLKEAGII